MKTVNSNSPVSQTNQESQISNLSTLPRMLPIKEVVYYVGLSQSTIYDMMDKKSKRYDPTFPTQVKLSQGRVAWIESEVADWLNARIAQRSAS